MSTIKSFKGFNKDMTCRGFKYEIGKEYKEEKAQVCNCGFHACEHPLDVFQYYHPSQSKFCEVEQFGEISKKQVIQNSHPLKLKLEQKLVLQDL